MCYNNNMTERKRKMRRKILCVLFVTIVTLCGVAIWLNYTTIRDYFVGINYQPSAEMLAIRDGLRLTERGIFIFNATQPELNERGDFNRNCRTGETDTAILGCYAREKIFVYDIRSEELEGIRELAMAHELLHAVYARMNIQEKDALANELAQVYDSNREILETEIGFYDEAERQEEIFVRAGTEIKDLPNGLEETYAQIFNDQDAVVEFYDGYIGVFREIEERQAEIAEELDAKKAELDSGKVNYARETAQLNADVVSFNACARVDGCIKSKTEFRERRAALINRRDELEKMYNEINTTVAEYNELVAEYNELVVHGQMLNDEINSAESPQEIE